jgi:hypothetical protein
LMALTTPSRSATSVVNPRMLAFSCWRACAERSFGLAHARRC